MGMGDVSRSVTPKAALLVEPRLGGLVAVQYLRPWQCHPSLAVTGGQCLVACLLASGRRVEGCVTPSLPPESGTERRKRRADRTDFQLVTGAMTTAKAPKAL